MIVMNESNEWDANVRHCAYNTDEAQSIAKEIGLRANTAKEVAFLLHEPMDKEKINRLCSKVIVDPSDEWSELNDCNWSQELDDEIYPYQKRAREVGILMTPILVVDGEVIWEGSVPSEKKLNELLG
jgi:hypothetical protein